MAVQIILCMETNKRAATDYVYIKDTINRFYALSSKFRISPVYMNGKSKYNSKDIKKSIQTLIKDFTIGITKVVYCIDTDLFESESDHAREFKEISEYCVKNGFELIWFCHDVEEVYIGRKVSDKQKITEANDFRKKNKVESVQEEKLLCEQKKKSTSNILCVLDRYLCRK